MSRNSTAFAEWGNEQCKRLVAPVPFSSPRCFFPTASVSFKKNSFRLLVVFHVSLCSSSFSICAFLSPFVCLSFGLVLKYSPCLPHVLSEQLCPFLPLPPPSFPLFFVVQPALHTSCPVFALSLASLCFSFVFLSFCKR